MILKRITGFALGAVVIGLPWYALHAPIHIYAYAAMLLLAAYGLVTDR